MSAKPWKIRRRNFDWGQRTYLMGVLNVTPDSFSDGGEFTQLPLAISRVCYLVAKGADIIDIGGQSTRPGAEPVSLTEELQRVVPVIEAIRDDANQALSSTVISVDTTRAAVAQAAIAAGADIVNDISGGTFEPEMLEVVAQHQVPYIMMHMRGIPQTMQQMTDYTDLIADIQGFLQQQAERAIAAGVAHEKIVIDPGIGFAKTYTQSLEVLRGLSALRALGMPLLVGPSRKSFIGRILNQPDAGQRVWGTAAACAAAIAGGADILRVHDVAEMQDVCRVADAIWRSPNGADWVAWGG
ncbi:MAG: dihydropteroate synthase [Leptolyngbyaceae cyanobacterium SM1_1_3]|nr:dihydropteroate synthase [Leptolyngbyaceae cyanobacterium SM1_1_3]NJN03711.1 dihydropteroate synthase [Leptolyngbyaceae cyanobacterium RM1_1_2]NJO09338.1 dihydropteroate synthase [Leptolyngbyaceae cyanobacterium SL_1_1]